MTVSKRLRYEVLRRDNHACRYCGRTAPDVPLCVDHVLPVALGGTDDPSNLVAACRDCNAGKAASNPDQPLVKDVSEQAIRWARAIALAAEEAIKEHFQLAFLRDEFYSAWTAWKYNDGQTIPLDPDWESSVTLMAARGLPGSLIAESLEVAMRRPGLPDTNRFKYFCGVAWRKLDEIEATARALIEAGEHG